MKIFIIDFERMNASINERMSILHTLIATRPFPPAKIILRLVHEAFSEMPPSALCDCTNHILLYIEQLELLTSLQSKINMQTNHPFPSEPKPRTQSDPEAIVTGMMANAEMQLMPYCAYGQSFAQFVFNRTAPLHRKQICMLVTAQLRATALTQSLAAPEESCPSQPTPQNQ